MLESGCHMRFHGVVRDAQLRGDIFITLPLQIYPFENLFAFGGQRFDSGIQPFQLLHMGDFLLDIFFRDCLLGGG